MSVEILTSFIGAIGSLLVLIRPLISLNRTLTQLNCNLETLKEHSKEHECKVDMRLDSHASKIDDHEKRICHLENGRYPAHKEVL